MSEDDPQTQDPKFCDQADGDRNELNPRLVGGTDAIFVAHSANCGNDTSQNRGPFETAA